MERNMTEESSHIFPAGLLQCVRLLQLLGLFPKLLDVVFHFLILAELLTQVVHKLSQESFTA